MAFLFDRVSLWRNAPLASLQRNVLVPRPWRGGKYRTYLASSTKSSFPASLSLGISVSHPHQRAHTHTDSHTFSLPVQGAGTGISVHVVLLSNENPPVCLLVGSSYPSIPNQMLCTPSFAIPDPSSLPVVLGRLSLDTCTLNIPTEPAIPAPLTSNAE